MQWTIKTYLVDPGKTSLHVQRIGELIAVEVVKVVKLINQ